MGFGHERLACRQPFVGVCQVFVELKDAVRNRFSKPGERKVGAVYPRGVGEFAVESREHRRAVQGDALYLGRFFRGGELKLPPSSRLLHQVLVFDGGDEPLGVCAFRRLRKPLAHNGPLARLDGVGDALGGMPS